LKARYGETSEEGKLAQAQPQRHQRAADQYRAPCGNDGGREEGRGGGMGMGKRYVSATSAGPVNDGWVEVVQVVHAARRVQRHLHTLPPPARNRKRRPAGHGR